VQQKVQYFNTLRESPELVEILRAVDLLNIKLFWTFAENETGS
jgi:hypothetical protein